MLRGMSKLADNDDVLSPSHYTWHPVCSAQEISGHFPHHLGAAIDYIWSVGRKDDPIQDIDKAIRHLEFERDRLARSAQTVSGTAPVPSFEQDVDKEGYYSNS